MSDPDEDESESNAVVALKVVGRGLAAAGRTVVNAYQAIDPDFRRQAYQLPLLGLMLLAPQRRVIEPLPDDGSRPLVFVHGLGGQPGNFTGLKIYFGRRGRTRAYTADFGNAASMEIMRQLLTEVIEQIIAVNELGDDDQIDIVAHSMGGLITRLALEEPDVRRRIANIVTLATPHSGSHLARLAATAKILALRPNSPTMQLLDAQDFWDDDHAPNVTALWSRADTVVLPGEHGQFEHGLNIEVEGSTHYSYLITPSVWRLIWNAVA